MQALFEAVRESCSSGTWSRGVELSRADAVVGERQGEDEIVVRVATRGGLQAPEVHLYPASEDWECDCRGADDPCMHVAAAVIALKRARERGEALPTPRGTSGRVGYRLHRNGNALEFGRVIVLPDGEERLRASLVAIASGAVDGPAFVASDADLRLEKRMDGRLSGVLPREHMPDLLRALAACDDVRLEGDPVSVSTEPILPLVVLEDSGDDFLLRLSPDAGRTEIFSNGVGVCEGVLRPLGDVKLGLREREQLVTGRIFSADTVSMLVGEVLPDLERRLPVDVRTSRLPGSERIHPRLIIESERRGDALAVVGRLVYGDPPRAHVVAGRLEHLHGPIPLRERRAEEQLVAALRRELALEAGVERSFEARTAIELVSRLERFEAGTVVGDHSDFRLEGELEPELASAADRFGIEFRTAGKARRADADRVLRTWRQGGDLVALEGGGFAPLPAAWLALHGDRLADLLAARSDDGTLPTCAVPDLARLCTALDAPVPPEFERLRGLIEDFDGLSDAVLPDDLTATLRDYQRRGVAWLAFLRDVGLGGLLADDMGLGKTLQALCCVRGRTLVVSPTSVLYGWQEQIARFRPTLRVCVYHGPRRALDPDADLVLTTYALLRLDAERLARESWSSVVLDEAQAIKNPQSQVARAAFALRADFRVTLTGTPVENRLEELWSQLHFTNPGLLGGRADFRERYARPVAEGEPGAAEHLRDRIRPFVLRRLKREVAPELPARTESVLHCELSEGERAVYDAVRAATRSDLVERLRGGGNVLEALEALLRLRQAACHSALIPGQSAVGSSKLDLLLEVLDEIVAEGHKALVFSQWTSLLDLIEPHLRDASLPFVRLDGSTRDRSSVVERFQSPDGPPIFLISLRAGGTGLNLTAADHVFLLDPWWNPAVEDQAADRAHRIGQERPVVVHRLVARETVEEGILALQESKRALADAALGGAERAASITREELLALLD